MASTSEELSSQAEQLLEAIFFFKVDTHEMKTSGKAKSPAGVKNTASTAMHSGHNFKIDQTKSSFQGGNGQDHETKIPLKGHIIDMKTSEHGDVLDSEFESY
jgi:hypothetical protein